MKRISALCAALVVLLVCLVGCTIGNPIPSGPPRVTSPGGGQSDPPSSGTPASPSAGSGDLGPIVASRTGTINGHRVEAQLHRIVRDQNLSQLSIELTTSSDDVTIGTALSDDNGAVGDVDTDTADGVTLIDPRRSKVYLVASSDFRCLCTRVGNTKLGPDQPLVVSATFAAPPDGVTALDVQIPGFGVVTGVPVV